MRVYNHHRGKLNLVTGPKSQPLHLRQWIRQVRLCDVALIVRQVPPELTTVKRV